jgi:hypothetical protein
VERRRGYVLQQLFLLRLHHGGQRVAHVRG